MMQRRPCGGVMLLVTLAVALVPGCSSETDYGETGRIG